MIKAKEILDTNFDGNLLNCPICKDLMNPDKAIQLDCSHIFCEDCIKDPNDIDVSIYPEILCPLCSEEHKYERVKLCNKFAYNTLFDVKIKCTNVGCCTVISNGDLDKHLKKCDYKLMDCPYCDKKNIYRKDYKSHLTENMSEHFLALIEEVETLKSKRKIF